MDTKLASQVSPLSRRRELTQSESDALASHVPFQKSVSSASQLPSSPHRSSPYSQLASPQYVTQLRALMERQREVHGEERQLWYIERKGLEEKIAQLEGSLRRYQVISSSQVVSPSDKNGPGANSSLWSLSSTDGSRHTSESGTGDEVWRGPKTDVRPTRTFSEDSVRSVKPGGRLPSIAENAPANRNSGKISREHSKDEQNGSRKSSISGADIDKNLDGITFKASGLAPGIAKNVMTPQSPSPRSKSPSKVSPESNHPLPDTLEEPEDIFTKDAGHTPLARRSYFNTDGPSSTGSGGAATPTQPELERPPLEPHTTAVKLPSERSDSYFPAVPEPVASDADPALVGPLGLTNDTSKDEKFLNVLDSKLMQAATSKEPETPTTAGASNNEREEGGNEAQEFEQPDHEPKLRIKRSMNFGSAFGSKSCGKGI